jgi:hypothetical protein
VGSLSPRPSNPQPEPSGDGIVFALTVGGCNPGIVVVNPVGAANLDVDQERSDQAEDQGQGDDEGGDGAGHR